MLKWIQTAITVVLLGVIVTAAYRLGSSKVELDIYRDRLASLSSDYESLRAMYNQAVRKTAVTELTVQGGRLSVAVRTIEGVQRTFETPFDPGHEIYCDYVLLDGRMWIRRVYDAQTPPREGLVIDENLAEVDWTDPAARHGNAVYRSLSEGRWIVTLTGDGSLGLAKVDADAEVTLSGPPPVRDYQEMLKGIDESMEGISAGEVLKRLVVGR